MHCTRDGFKRISFIIEIVDSATGNVTVEYR